MKKVLLCLLSLCILITQALAYNLTVIVDKGLYRYNKGVGQTIKVDFDKNVISGWKVNFGEVSVDESNSFIMPEEDVEIEAIYKTYTISYDANGGENAPASQTKTYGVNLTLSSTTPNKTGYTFSGWATSSTATVAEYQAGGTFMLDEDTTLYAVWQISATITATSGSGGTITPSETIVVTPGSDYTYTVKSNSGYKIEEVKVDGESVEFYKDITTASTYTNDSTYTFTESDNGTPSGNDWIYSSANSRYQSNIADCASTTATSTININLSGTATLSFDYLVSSESGYDKFTVTVKDASGTTTVANQISGESSSKYSKSVTDVDGVVTITLTYSKDSSTNSGSDLAAISNLKLNQKVGSNKEYVHTFTNVTSSHTIEATFVVSQQDLVAIASVGEYITYVPSSTNYTVSTSSSGYSSDQTFNPSSITSWRIFSNDGTKVTLISTESVGSLTLSGATGYAKIVDTLNNLSSAYVNSTYATSGRSLGCTSSSVGSISTSSLTHGVSGEPYLDIYYLTDYNIMYNNGLAQSSGTVWMASRYSDTFTKSTYSYTKFNGRIAATTSQDNGVLTGPLYNYENGTWSSTDNAFGVRPIITLKTGLKVSGAGTVDDPYVLQ